MTGADIKQFFENIISDTLDEDFTYDLMNDAKDEIEADRDWEILKSKDTTNSTTVGGTYATEYSLPSDFLSLVKDKAVWVDEDECYPVPFEEQIKWKDIGQRYFVDYKNSKLHLCGTITSSKTIAIFYIYKTDDITSTTSPVFPSKFHKIYAYKMAEMYLAGIDSDDINRSMSPQHQSKAERLYKAMVRWDTRLKMNARDNSVTRRSVEMDRQGFVDDDVLGY